MFHWGGKRIVQEMPWATSHNTTCFSLLNVIDYKKQVNDRFLGEESAMQEVVLVSNIEKKEKLKVYLEELFNSNRYAEITEAIGMHSLFVDPQHTMKDQARLYNGILRMIKDRVSRNKGNNYGTWYKNFPQLMDTLVSSKQIVADKASLDVIASYREAYGAFKSVDDFFFWALNDRKLSLDQIVTCIEKTAEIHGK
jgi:hypothetical protein